MSSSKILKGQLISNCLFEIIVWTKIPTKNLIVSALALSGQKLSNFSLVFWSKRRLQKDILKLTDLYYYYQSTYCTVDTQKQLQIVFCPIVTRRSLYLKASVIYPRNASFQLNSSLIS